MPTTSSPALSPSTPNGTAASSTVYRPLNVKDALSYLDQVKLKFAGQPNVYNRFLDIMKDFKSQLIDTPGVIERVSALFRGHPSLMSGFNTFLPPGYKIECSRDQYDRDIIEVTTPTGTIRSIADQPLDLRSNTPGRQAPVEFDHAITFVNKIKRHFSDRPDIYKQFLEILQTYQRDQNPIQEVYQQVRVLFNDADELLAEFKKFLPDVSGQVGKSGMISMPSLTKKRRTKLHHKTDVQMSDVRSAGAPMEEEPEQSAIPAEEKEFFNRAKEFIGNETTYMAFLKVLNLFSQEIVDQNVLINRVESFIGGDRQLFDWFKTLIGYDGKDDIIESTSSGVLKLSTNQNGDVGPSYRTVPKSWQRQPCSGRDNLCWEVLNDEYVSHPTWASEDTGFVASKKNRSEEALHRVEEERYDYDLNIEANLNTIALLEPVAKKISAMSAQEKASFRLPPGLGGPSKTIYQRILKKIYGNDKGLEIIDLLHNNPAQTVPIVLKRLKQKDDEWKRAQREWNKIWLEIETTNYYRALDYQGFKFKTNDRKAMNMRTLVTQIEAIQRPQLSYEFTQATVYKDIHRLILYLLPRQEIFNEDECDKIRKFMEEFIPLIFHTSGGSTTISTEEDEMMNEAEDEADESRSMQSFDSDGDAVMSNNRGTPKKTRAQRYASRMRAMGEDPSLFNGTASPVRQSRQDKDQEGDTEASSTSSKEPKAVHLFSNDALYCFIRVYQMLYERLARMKALDAEYKKDPEKAKECNRAALELGITSKTFDAVKLNFKRGYYNALLRLINKLINGDVDQQTFEDCTRYIFGTNAYVLFTIDKMLLTLMRCTHRIDTGAQTKELLELFKKELEIQATSDTDPVAMYRVQAEEIVNPGENLYIITFKPDQHKLSIQLLRKDETLSSNVTPHEGYEEYVANYIDWANETKGIPQAQLTPRFLKRNLRDNVHDDRLKDILVQSGMQYKICRNTYHMFYIIGTEDTFMRRRADTAASTSEDRDKTWRAWLESEKGWSHDIADKTKAEQDARNWLNGQISEPSES
ncbi:uncharacterized protein BYT42DRAFT_499846 [Radiomyces spectabilis]|uniref:uncharacterized protein n=1 Tax=Radiomyces spectabilis TaxID=64574 RepID=UPI00221EDAF8|nr:uncharacterized protein BYT42DRAFT_499846 [Radiomyces spectabilis]KAI8374728.1 hypothetical protein BYT42DRAFT_499846 [Radiomyces spectabilis]